MSDSYKSMLATFNKQVEKRDAMIETRVQKKKLKEKEVKRRYRHYCSEANGTDPVFQPMYLSDSDYSAGSEKSFHEKLQFVNEGIDDQKEFINGCKADMKKWRKKIDKLDEEEERKREW